MFIYCKGEVIIINAEEFENISGEFNLLKLLASAEEDVRGGRYKEAKPFFKKFRREKKI